MRTFTIQALTAASGFPERSIRQYVNEGFLPRPPYRGKNTLYGEAHLVHLLAIAKLRGEQKLWRMSALRAWFAGKSAAEIESFVSGVPIAPPAPPPAPVVVAPPPPPPAPEPEPEPEPAPAIDGGERWTHLPLVPGMTLLVKEGAPEVVQRLAGEIRAKYGMGKYGMG